MVSVLCLDFCVHLSFLVCTKRFHSIPYTPNWEGRKIRENDEMGWNGFHYISLHYIRILTIQTTETHCIPLYSAPFHWIPPIQT